MSELFHQQHQGEIDQNSRAKLLARSIGGAAFILAGVWVGKRIAPYAKPTALDLLDRLDVVERRGHPQMVNTFKSLAESFGVEVQEEHLEYWQSVLTIARALDSVIDGTQPTSLSAEVGALLSGEPVPGITADEAEKFFNIVTSASDARHDIIMDGLDVKDITEKIHTCSDPNEVIKLRKEEGEVLARNINDVNERIRATSDPKEMLELRRKEGEFFGRIMTIENPNDDPSIETFNKRVVELCITGYVFDSLVDLAEDHRDGVTAVAPTPDNYFAIGKEVVKDGLTSLSHLPARSIAGLAVVGLQHAVRKSLGARPRELDHY